MWTPNTNESSAKVPGVLQAVLRDFDNSSRSQITFETTLYSWMVISPRLGKVKFKGLVKTTRHARLFADKRGM